MPRTPKLDTFTRAYIEAALWSTTDDSDESGGEPLDENYGVSDFAPETLERILQDTEQFQRENAEALEVIDSAGAGHDFWLTRVGHGAGFWDGDWPEPQATLLTKASERMGHVDLHVGDDGMLYMTPGRKEAEGHARRLEPKAFEGADKHETLRRWRVVVREDGSIDEGVEGRLQLMPRDQAYAMTGGDPSRNVYRIAAPGSTSYLRPIDPRDVPVEVRRRLQATAQGHDLARVAYVREFERKFPRGMDGLDETTGRFRVGERVQLHPGTDRWMMGDRYGEVVKVTREYVHVKLDKSGKTLRFSEDRLMALGC